ncbi:MAG: alpha-galactosidase [Pseudomonadota bacterium]
MQTYRLNGAETSAIITVRTSGGPILRYLGGKLSDDDLPIDEPKLLRPAGPDDAIHNDMFPVHGWGFEGEPALIAYTDQSHFVTLSHRDTEFSNHAELALSYDVYPLQAILRLSFHFDKDTDVFYADAEIENGGTNPLHIEQLAALSIPLPDWVRFADAGYGVWSGEGRSKFVDLSAGAFEQCGRIGRPGFNGGPFLLLTESDMSGDFHREELGREICTTLAFSGNYALRVERQESGLKRLSVSEWLAPGERILKPGETYKTPPALLALSDAGRRGISRRLHAAARASTPSAEQTRPVQFNTWEAAYFSVNEKTAMRLAERASELGCERFVLDDGWFAGRDNDQSSLGDWRVCKKKFPQGLKPLTDQVKALGMDFGLWLEPEMVNPDSDLFRRHPEWALQVDGANKPTGRNQLVLDYTRTDVRNYITESLFSLLEAEPIDYLKWDYNRALYPASSGGRNVAGEQIRGLYSVLATLRDAFPHVSIESCASGGGRLDFGILSFTDRFWTSDATDPFERVRIQRRASVFFPLNMLGAHVGPNENPWTGRRTNIAFRCMTALFGSFGVEADPDTLTVPERNVLKRAISFYKAERRTICEGELLRLPAPAHGVDAQMIISADKKRALLRLLRTDTPDTMTNVRIQPIHLPEGERWRVTCSDFERDAFSVIAETASSYVLTKQGLSCTLTQPGTGLIFVLEAE